MATSSKHKMKNILVNKKRKYGTAFFKNVIKAVEVFQIEKGKRDNDS